MRHDPVNHADDPRLRIHCPFPAANASLRLSKECIDRRFELSAREVTGRRSVVLTKIVDCKDGKRKATYPNVKFALAQI